MLRLRSVLAEPSCSHRPDSRHCTAYVLHRLCGGRANEGAIALIARRSRGERAGALFKISLMAEFALLPFFITGLVARAQVRVS